MNNNITVFWHTLNKIKFEKPSKLIVIFMAKLNTIMVTISERLEGIEDKFTKIMMRLSIIKLAVAMITLLGMTVLLFTHLDAFGPITMQFSKWVSSPIICFIMLVIVAKFVGLGIGLTLTVMSIKDLTFVDLKIELRKYCKQNLRFFYKKKVLPQKA
ncbi:MAG: hypothetical protein ACYSTS_08095 [Planctomycetota bacterium]|jgi:hypothetical protein